MQALSGAGSAAPSPLLVQSNNNPPINQLDWIGANVSPNGVPSWNR
jgi:hypothetical protein